MITAPPAPDPEPTPVSQMDMFKMFQEIMKDVEKRKQLVALLAGVKPKNWKRVSNSPYYKSKYGYELRGIVDQMIELREDTEYRYCDFPRISKSSLYLRVNQAKRFILDNLDDDNKYAQFFELINITRERTGVRLTLDEEFRDPSKPYLGATVVSKEKQRGLQGEIDDWLEHAKVGNIFRRSKLALDPEAIHDIEVSMQGLMDVVFSITTSTIKIVKVEPEIIEGGQV